MATVVIDDHLLRAVLTGEQGVDLSGLATSTRALSWGRSACSAPKTAGAGLDPAFAPETEQLLGCYIHAGIPDPALGP